VKALIEERCCLALRALVGFLFSYENFNLLGKETANRSGTPGRTLTFRRVCRFRLMVTFCLLESREVAMFRFYHVFYV
jgi:hypothetical protein